MTTNPLENLAQAAKEAGLTADRDDLTSFKQAYDKIKSQNRVYIHSLPGLEPEFGWYVSVRICDVRRELNWTPCLFETVLEQLRSFGCIRVFSKDETAPVLELSGDDIDLSFRDKHGKFYWAMLWEKSIPVAVLAAEEYDGSEDFPAQRLGLGAVIADENGMSVLTQIANALERIADALERPYKS